MFILWSCAGTKDQGKDQKASIPPPHINCPEGGDCSFEVLKNSVLNLKYSDTGQLYPEIVEGDQIVVKFHFKKDPVENVMDSGYSEYVFYLACVDYEYLGKEQTEQAESNVSQGRESFPETYNHQGRGV